MEELVIAMRKKGVDVKDYGEYIRGQCPFRENHNAVKDGSNSFFLTPSKNSYHCFSCKASGKAVTLLTRNFDVPFSTVMKHVTLSGLVDSNDHVEEIHKKVADLILDMTQPYPEKYLSRGINERTLKKFKVSSKPPSKGKSETTVIPYFEGSDLVAIKNVWMYKGKRNAKIEGDLPKEHIYNFKPCKETILVEGESDVWNIHQCGKHSESTMTSSISREQLLLLSSHEKIFLMYDNDWPGYQGMERAYLMLNPFVEVVFARYDEEDPGVIKRRSLSRAIKQAEGYLEYSMRMTSKYGQKYLDMRNKIKSKFDSENRF